jgi:hypothetical protein
MKPIEAPRIRIDQFDGPPDDKADEPQWFGQLPVIDPAKLQKGDILLKKDFEMHSFSAKGQKKFTKHKNGCSDFTGHAALNVANGKVHALESSGSANALRRCPDEEFVATNWLVYQCIKSNVANKAAATALEWANSTSPIVYAKTSCLATAGGNGYGLQAKQRRKKYINGEKPEKLMCSEFVISVYHSYGDGSDLPWIDLTQMSSPKALEYWLNRSTLGPQRFKFAGVMGPFARV